MATRPDFFASCETPDQVKAVYRRMAMRYHPDRGGSHEAMVDLNAQYESALRRMSGDTFSTADGKKDYTYTYDHAKEAKVMETLFALLAAKMAGVRIEIIGTWIWVSGNTKIYKDTILKPLKLRWSKARKKWYFTTSKYRGGGKYKRKSFDSLRGKYGARVIQEE